MLRVHEITNNSGLQWIEMQETPLKTYCINSLPLHCHYKCLIRHVTKFIIGIIIIVMTNRQHRVDQYICSKCQPPMTKDAIINFKPILTRSYIKVRTRFINLSINLPKQTTAQKYIKAAQAQVIPINLLKLDNFLYNEFYQCFYMHETHSYFTNKSQAWEFSKSLQRVREKSSEQSQTRHIMNSPTIVRNTGPTLQFRLHRHKN